jgi:hypothetical protein
VKKYVELTLRKVVTSYVVAVVDTDLDGADLECAAYTPEQFKDAENPWNEWRRDYYQEPNATEYELEGVRVMLPVEQDNYRRDENALVVPFIAEKSEE